MAVRDRSLHCSFCGKDQSEVRKLVAGPYAFICNECVDICVGIICEEADKKGQSLDELLPIMTGKQSRLTTNTRHH